MATDSKQHHHASESLIADLRQTLSRLESGLALISDALCVADQNYQVLWCNSQFESLVQAPRLMLLGMPIVDLINRLPMAERRFNFRDTLGAKRSKGAIDLLMQRDPISAIRIEWSRVEDGSTPITIFTFKDTSDRITLEELRAGQVELLTEETRFEIASALCPVTGLKMRHSMLRDIETLLHKQEGELVALLLINLKAFRLINDRHGYPAGDELLAEVARRLKGAVRTDDLIARMGGDQFGVLAYLTSVNELELLTERLTKAVEGDPFLPTTTHAMVELRPQCDLGSAVIRAGQSSSTSLLRAAELALDRVRLDKSATPGISGDDLAASLNAELAVSAAVEHCLQTNLIPIALQPMVTLETGAFYGFEALARPQDATGATIPVDRFMALSEKLGLMESIGELLVRSAFDTFRRAKLAHSGMRLSLNLSPSQFTRRGVADRIEKIASQFSMPFHLLTIEITETALIANESLLQAEVEALRGKGATVLLDDFGTGYSSLNWIFNVPTDGIKIDKSYTSQMTDPHRRLVMAGIAGMCRDLGLDAIVEGIETEEQRSLLLELGYKRGQGYLFGKPMLLEDLDTTQTMARSVN